MAAGFPAKTSFADGTALPASDLNDVTGTLNLIKPTAKGDLFVGSAANTYTKLSVGTDAQVLTASSTATTGVVWTGAPAGSMTLIASGTPTAASSTYTFSSIPSTYKNLYCTFNLIQSNTAANTFCLRVNNIGGAAYNAIYMLQGQTAIQASNLASYIPIFITTSSYPFVSGSFTIPNYTYSTVEAKRVFFESSGMYSSNGTFGGLTLGVGSANNTATPPSGFGAINRIDIFPVSGTFNAQGTIALYGVN